MHLKQLIGDMSTSDNHRLRRARIHQGWWRAFVLKLEQGEHPINPDKTICSSLPAAAADSSNFISAEIGALAMCVAQEHKASKERAGIIDIKRLTGNLLTSQAVCFNFFGMLALDHDLGLRVVQAFYPDVTAFTGVNFEYAPAPKADFTNDNSAFDVALEVMIGEEEGLIGFECKYTEDFSPTPYEQAQYRKIYSASANFNATYEELTASRFNQLFRNQLIAESLLQSGRKKFVKTGLFCAPDDVAAKNTASAFSQFVKSDFKVIDFFDYIVAIQKLLITPRQREQTMLLWARYLAHELSAAAAAEFYS
ncbi:PGN_0703 family putative restriction endonuclease [Undibacterium sp. JH2W]|uniref:PGN_0703 family putative restriction endonuclease n=1 Tax=Undibacterium sp. JH2W TaxID=3413037 RepID=UPI003BF154C7